MATLEELKARLGDVETEVRLVKASAMKTERILTGNGDPDRGMITRVERIASAAERANDRIGAIFRVAVMLMSVVLAQLVAFVVGVVMFNLSK